MRGAALDEPDTYADHVRTCADCRRAKSIRGVWYLVPGRGSGAPFVCEACFGYARPMRAVI